MELPNLSVIKEISGNDIEFQNSILEIIKTEFPEEVDLFKQNFNSKNYIEASNNVHKIKHKISLLALNNGLQTAADYELALKKANTELHKDFLEVLDKIHVYLYE
ncbi:hypothetical protein BW723_04475 [Polaribacter reichenbachii]|uniref:Histidine kinase n=1 Tax=Polaribacter reichenbachii TaxID=996801 RepID=A0A1B8TUR1_9FLAO|nr:hypothetical protein [Polaribacter reichenbachii]APZ45596.1 hypothetical protein BW723_04475 [Polaribacter reichenbachii]AUC19458.1 hypothetical protein BTO17_12480 [Polaribacter reichenbachii]OBY63387.1 hypothetical protein LPB301_11235 [Polaribacter reichenbachii]